MINDNIIKFIYSETGGIIVLRKDVLFDSFQLAIMGFKPCVDGDLRLKVADGYGEGYIVLAFGEENTHYIFEQQREDQYVFVQELLN